MRVTYRYIRPLTVVYARSTGPYQLSCREAWGRMSGWLDQRQARWRVKQGYGYFRDNPKLTAPDLLRYDACVPVTFGLDPDPERGIGRQTLPGGAYAVHTHVGSYAEIGGLFSHLHREIVPKRGLSLDYARAFVTIYPQRSEHHPRNASPHGTVRAGLSGADAAFQQRRRCWARRRPGFRRRSRAVGWRANRSLRQVTVARRPETMARSQRRGPRMPKIDETRPFIPVRIAVLTVSDTRGLADDRSGDTLVQLLESGGAPVGGPRPRQGRRRRDQGQGAGLDRRSRRVDVVITTGGTGFTGRDVTPEAVKPLFEKEVDGFSTVFHMVPFRKWGPPRSSRAPAPAWRAAPTSSACRGLPAPARMRGTISSSGSSTTVTVPAISSRSCRGWRSIAARVIAPIPLNPARPALRARWRPTRV